MSASAMTLHEECWLMLPWLANGRLDAAERARLEQHVRGCAECARELQLERGWCDALTEPERITYTPGPAFRKLMERIEEAPEAGAGAPATPAARAARTHAAWRPPGFAWAASFVLTLALGALGATAYRWSQPLYATLTSAPVAAPGVLHVAFERSLPIGDAEQLLLSAGARVVEGPDASGVFGVAPVAAPGTTQAPDARLRALAQRLRSDPEVRWVEPLPGGTPRRP
ncbi:MAG TPA: zf-HC2 domain-containing protein [Steroidobacteraceae bacterium]|nr:zf-HC2 domain-containing protein [Steroidobacteraceae bacterium]